MEITKRGSSQVQCAEQKVSQYAKPTLSTGLASLLGEAKGGVDKYKVFKSSGTFTKHTGMSSSLCRSESHLCL